MKSDPSINYLLPPQRILSQKNYPFRVLSSEKRWDTAGVTARGKTAPTLKRLLPAVVLALGALLAPGFSHAASGLSVHNPYRELVDVGTTQIEVHIDSYSGPAYRLACSAGNLALTRNKGAIHIDVVIEPGNWNGPSPCSTRIEAGELPAGNYVVNADLLTAPGAVREILRLEFSVITAANRCNTNPAAPYLIVLHNSYTVAEFLARLQSDPVFAAMLSNPVSARPLITSFPEYLPPYVVLQYAPLENLIMIADRLNKSGQFKGAGPEGAVCFFGVGDKVEPVVEFLNTATGHYFYTAELPEIRAIDRGDAGPGWVRTGSTFNASTVPGCPAPVTGFWGPVYRFYGVPGIGPNSHFYTSSPEECFAAKSDPGCRFESTPFWARGTYGGVCGDGKVPLYRAYNNRWRENDSNHRYTTDRAAINDMKQRGWSDEGIVMCVQP